MLLRKAPMSNVERQRKFRAAHPRYRNRYRMNLKPEMIRQAREAARAGTLPTPAPAEPPAPSPLADIPAADIPSPFA